MRLNHILLCFLPLALIACSLKPKSERAIQSEQSIVTKNYKWSKKDLTVCFLDSSEQLESYGSKNLLIMKDSNAVGFAVLALPDIQKKAIQDAVESSFNKANLNLNFTGWKSCSDTEIPDVAVGFSYSPYVFNISVSSIGDPSKKHQAKKINLVRLNLGFNTINEDIISEVVDRYPLASADQKKLIEAYKFHQNMNSIVHEFGHIAGLHHEHYRTDSYEMMKSADITYNSNAARNLISENMLMKLGQSPEAQDFLTVGAYDPFSSMNYMNGFNHAMLEIALKCTANKYAFLSRSELKHVCNYAELKKYISRENGQSYLSEGDIQALKVLYSNQASDMKMGSETQKMYNWILQTKKIIEKHQLKFPQTLNDDKVDVPLESWFCPFNQEAQAKVLRVSVDKNANITQAWYSQTKYNLPYFSYHGFQFTSVKKTESCKNCFELSADYKGKPFTTTVKPRASGDRFILRIEDLGTNAECYKSDILVLAEMVKQNKKSQMAK